MKILVVAVALVVLASCAKKPEDIAPINVGDSMYANFSCEGLTGERLKITQELQALSAKQRSAAKSDAWGVFLLGVPWSSMSGNDKEALIAVAKGRVQAIDRQRVAKRCR